MVLERTFNNLRKISPISSSQKKSRKSKKKCRWIKKNLNIAVRIILAFVLTGAVFTIAVKFEPTEQSTNLTTNPGNTNRYQCGTFSSLHCFLSKVSESKLLAPVQTFGVIVAAFLYLFDLPDRKKQAERQAWQLIDGARDVETSGARFEALEELNQGGNSLWGLDADGADLIEINLPGADLDNSNLEKALLREANLQRTSLRQAKLRKADLQGANLKGADLWAANLQRAKLEDFNHSSITNLQEANLGLANLEGASLNNANLSRANLNGACLERADLCRANLSGADLCNANLSEADFRKANLSGADFRKAKLSGADFREADLSGARFREAPLLTLEQVQCANNWKKAKYDKTFCEKYQNLGLNLLQDEPEENEINENQLNENKRFDERKPRENRKERPEIQLIRFLQKLPKKKNEIATILQNLAELIKLIDSDSSASLQNNPIVKDLINAWESLIAEEDVGKNNAERTKKGRELIEEFRDSVIKRDNVAEKTQEYKNREQAERKESEKDEKTYLIAAKWLESNRQRIRIEAVRHYLDNNLQANQRDEIIDSDEKVRQLEIEMNKCLRQLIDCLNKLNKPDYTNVELSLPISISEVFRVILDWVIPEVLKPQSNELSREARECLNDFLESSINELQQK